MSDGESRSTARAAIGEPLAVRVGFAGGNAKRVLGGGVEAIDVDAGDEAPPGVAAIVADAGGREAELEALAAKAGVPLIVLDTDGAQGRGHRIGAPGDGRLAAAPTLDPRQVNPIEFRHTEVAGFGCLVSGGRVAGLAAAFAELAEAASGEPLEIYTLPGAELGDVDPRHRVHELAAPRPKGVVRNVRSRLGILDHPAFHGSEWERAGWIAKLCASGMPVVVAGMSDRLRELLGPELSGLLEGVSAAALSDLDERERISVGLRRAALRNHSSIERWRQIAAFAGIEVPDRPKVSVVFATRREEWLPFGLAQIERQSYEPMELCVCLHGRRFFSEAAEQTIRDNYSGEFQVIWVDEELTLGDALNSGVAATDGELVTKMDDDDFYNVDHLWDLMLASEYSGAALVGKAAEFAYLDWVDLTIRRFMGDAETDHPRLAGGGLAARRKPLEAIGGWPQRSRGEDTWVVKNMKRSGEKTHRTHGYGYILNRHGRGHTWNTYADYFLIQSQREYRGLRFDVTAIEPPAEDLVPRGD
ncbi:glycosyltransferase family 2 protein [Thermoleophilia bacterium SCSIO 60948]|nr:glycosyltransferase family 2 protein [Thermoleophilia bacterium SCSIO 60948]